MLALAATPLPCFIQKRARLDRGRTPHTSARPGRRATIPTHPYTSLPPPTRSSRGWIETLVGRGQATAVVFHSCCCKPIDSPVLCGPQYPKDPSLLSPPESRAVPANQSWRSACSVCGSQLVLAQPNAPASGASLRSTVDAYRASQSLSSLKQYPQSGRRISGRRFPLSSLRVHPSLEHTVNDPASVRARSLARRTSYSQHGPSGLCAKARRPR